MSVSAKRMQHSHITRNKQIRDGEPVITATGIRVIDIAVRYELMDMSPEEIIIALPHLNLSQVHDALSYYYEHKNEMDKSWKNALKTAESLKKSSARLVEKKLGRVKNLHR